MQRPPLPPAEPQLAKPQERLAGLSFGILKDGQIRKKFQALGIPSSGDKELLKNRYTEWQNIWNANCDSSHPKSKQALLNDLKKWERTQGGQAKEGDGFSIMKKDFDATSWQTSNKDDFARLIAQARKGAKQPKDEHNANKGALLEEDHVQAIEMDPRSSAMAQPQQDTARPPVPQAHTSTPGRQTPRDGHSDCDDDDDDEDNNDNNDNNSNNNSYENNPEAIASIRAKVAAANAGQKIEPLMNSGFASTGLSRGALPSSGQTNMSSSALYGDAKPAKPSLEKESSLGEHFAHQPDRRMSMFRVPEDPVSDNEQAH